jgi:hypothetical protein
MPPKECREDLNTMMKVSVWSLINNTCIIQKEQTNTRDCLNNMHHPFLILNNIFYMLKFQIVPNSTQTNHNKKTRKPLNAG